MENNINLAQGNVAQNLTVTSWNRIAQDLNNTPDGVVKDVTQWRRVILYFLNNLYLITFFKNYFVIMC